MEVSEKMLNNMDMVGLLYCVSGYHKKFGGYKGYYGGSKGKKYKGGKHAGKYFGDDFGKKASKSTLVPCQYCPYMIPTLFRDMTKMENITMITKGPKDTTDKKGNLAKNLPTKQAKGKERATVMDTEVMVMEATEATVKTSQCTANLIKIWSWNILAFSPGLLSLGIGSRTLCCKKIA